MKYRLFLLLLTKMRTTKSLLERSSDLLSFDCLSLVVARANFFFVGKKVGGGAEREVVEVKSLIFLCFCQWQKM